MPNSDSYHASRLDAYWGANNIDWEITVTVAIKYPTTPDKIDPSNAKTYFDAVAPSLALCFNDITYEQTTTEVRASVIIDVSASSQEAAWEWAADIFSSEEHDLDIELFDKDIDYEIYAH